MLKGIRTVILGVATCGLMVFSAPLALANPGDTPDPLGPPPASSTVTYPDGKGNMVTEVNGKVTSVQPLEATQVQIQAPAGPALVNENATETKGSVAQGGSPARTSKKIIKNRAKTAPAPTLAKTGPLDPAGLSVVAFALIGGGILLKRRAR